MRAFLFNGVICAGRAECLESRHCPFEILRAAKSAELGGSAGRPVSETAKRGEQIRLRPIKSAGVFRTQLADILVRANVTGCHTSSRRFDGSWAKANAIFLKCK